MSRAPTVRDLEDFADGDATLEYVRRVPQEAVARNVDNGNIELIPQKAFVFNPDLSIHQVEIIRKLGATVVDEYEIPPNGAVRVPTERMVQYGAFLKHTPHDDERVLGPAHHSLYGPTLTPSKTDKAAMRDILIDGCTWLCAAPGLLEAPA